MYLVECLQLNVILVFEHLIIQFVMVKGQMWKSINL